MHKQWSIFLSRFLNLHGATRLHCPQHEEVSAITSAEHDKSDCPDLQASAGKSGNHCNRKRSLSAARTLKTSETYLLSTMTVSARNVFRYLYSIFMFAAFLLIFVFAPLVLFFGSLVFHYPRSFVLRVRIFLHIVYLASL